MSLIMLIVIEDIVCQNRYLSIVVWINLLIVESNHRGYEYIKSDF